MIASWLVTALAFLIGDRLLDGVFVHGLFPALVASAVLGILNLTVRNALLVLTLPITIVTLGLFIFVLNAVTLLLTSLIVPGFRIELFSSAILLAVIVALANMALGAMRHDARRQRRWERAERRRYRRTRY